MSVSWKLEEPGVRDLSCDPASFVDVHVAVMCAMGHERGHRDAWKYPPHVDFRVHAQKCRGGPWTRRTADIAGNRVELLSCGRRGKRRWIEVRPITLDSLDLTCTFFGARRPWIVRAPDPLGIDAERHE